MKPSPSQFFIQCAIGLTATGTMLSACSVGALWREECRRYESVVLLHGPDSTRLKGFCRLPDYRTGTLHLRTSAGKRLRLCADSTELLAIKRQGEAPSLFIHEPYRDRSNRSRPTAWMRCMGIGPHLRLAAVGGSWQWGKMNEGAVAISFADGDAYLVGFKAGQSEGTYLTTLGRSEAVVRRALCRFLADDPTLCAQLAERSVSALDYAEVCRRYQPSAQPAGSTYEVRLIMPPAYGKGGLP